MTTVSVLLDHGAKTQIDRALLRATRHGRANIVTLLVTHGANPNATENDGDTPLHIAATDGNRGLVLALLKAGANPMLKNNYNHTPVDLALQYHPDTATMIAEFVAHKTEKGDKKR